MAFYLFNFTKKAAEKSKSLQAQAANLLEIKLWGIGDSTQNRDVLTEGDKVLAYVGAPEKAFIGHATLASGVHAWTPEEAARYPGSWKAGVAFAESEVWDTPVSLSSVWDKMPSAASDPGASFRGGVRRIKEGDYEIVIADAGASDLHTEPQKTPPPHVVSAVTSADKMYAACERLRKFLAEAKTQSISEAATRSLFIDKYLDALGYSDFADLEFGVPVIGGDQADYVVNVNGQRTFVVEAKKLGTPLGEKEGAQLVKYATVLTARWGIVTDGRIFKLYDPWVQETQFEDRLVFEHDLADYPEREDFEVLVYSPDLSLLTKESMSKGKALERRAAQKAIEGVLTNAKSQTIGALKSELQNKKQISLEPDELAELISESLT